MPERNTIFTRSAATWLLLALLALFVTSTVYLNGRLAQEKTRTEQIGAAYTALNSAIEKRVVDGITQYKKAAADVAIDDLIDSGGFSNLTKEQQEFFKKLQPKQRTLVAAAQVVLYKHDTIYQTVQAPVDTAKSDSTTVCYPRGSTVTLADTTQALKWHTKITLDDSVNFKLGYTYRPKLTPEWHRDKDGAHVTVSVDDPGLEVQRLDAILIPNEEQSRSRVGKWLYKNRWAFRTVAGVGLIYTGFRLGRL